MLVDQSSFIRERPLLANKELFCKLYVYLSRNVCWATTPLKIHSSPAKSHKIVTDNFFTAFVGMQLASRNPLLRTSGYWLGIFLQSLLGHSLQNALWLSPTLSQNFRGTFAKIPLSADPSHQQGAHQRKSKHQGPSRLALAKPHFWKLGCCVWNLFLETSESNVRQYRRQVQGGAWRPMKWCHSPAGPQAAGGGSP